MGAQRSRNLGLLSRRFGEFRKKAVVAIEFGQDILMHGMQSRAPRRTLKLVNSIRKTKVKNDQKKHRLVGRVIVTDKRAKVISLEYGSRHNRAFPFVRPTQAIDGPVAVQAMVEILT